MNATFLLALVGVVLVAVGVLPGCLGVLMLTHKITARPLGAALIHVASGPIWAVGVAATIGSVWLASQGGGSLTLALAAAAGVAGISVFGFFMHMRFMFRPVRKPAYLTPDQAIERFGETEEVAGVFDRPESSTGRGSPGPT